MVAVVRGMTSAHMLITFNLCLVVLLINVSASGFDLNEMPEEEQQSTATEIKSPQPARSGSGGSSKRAQTTNEKKKISPAFYEKVMKLFKVLEICDVDRFTLDSMPIPEDFSAQTKAMMALEKVAKSNLIKKSDKPKYGRIMENCKKISEKITKQKEKAMSLDSQTSGGTYEDRMARQMYEMAHSVLDGMRDRFTGLSNKNQPPVHNVEKKPVEQIKQDESTPIARLQTDETVMSKPMGAVRNFFQFF